MYYGKIYYCDTANGTGCRTVLFVSGCRHHCKGCFNQETWNFQYGYPYTKETENKIINSLQPNYIQGLTILGGEPFEPENQETIKQLVKHVKTQYPNKDIWIYSGYTWEELTHQMPSICYTKHTIDILKNIDVLVDGEYQEQNHKINLNYKGSTNQRIIHVPKSLKNTKEIHIEL